MLREWGGFVGEREEGGVSEQAWLAHVYVTLKTVVNDPQGLAIADGLHTMGYAGVEDVRAGKYLQVRLRALALRNFRFQRPCLLLEH